jgi:hypothetical protein
MAGVSNAWRKSTMTITFLWSIPYPALILSSYERALEVIAKAFTFVSLNRSTNGDEFPALFTIVIQERHACRFVHVGVRATAVENNQVFVSPWFLFERIHRGETVSYGNRKNHSPNLRVRTVA